MSYAAHSSVSCLQYASSFDIHTLSLHDALPIWREEDLLVGLHQVLAGERVDARDARKARELVGEGVNRLLVCFGVDVGEDRKSTRLNSSHGSISYAVFCLKKKK